MLHRALRMLFVLTIVGSLFVIVPAAPAAAAGGMTIRADTAYDIQTEAGLVAVTSDITVTNVTADKRSGYTITQYYYYAFSLPIPPEAENVAATSGGRNLTVDVTDGESDMYKIAEIRLRSRLYYKQSHSIQLTFDFVGQEPRSDDSAVRVNDAFVWFFAWALGDANRATVRITAPPEMDVSIDGSSMRHSVNEEGFDTWVAEDIVDPAEWFVTFTGFADDRLAQTDLEVAGNGIEVRYWPGDEEWRDDVVGTVDEALPALAEKLGLDWPVDGDLVIRETVIPNYFGYAGWYFVEDDIIEMGEYTDTEVIVHEVSHAWFNDDLFDSRWIVEGLAQAVTEEILLDDFSERVAPETIDKDDAAFRKLNTWTFLSAGSMDDDVEYVGYNSSWWIVGEILDEIEVEGLQEVLVAALDNEIAYLGAGEIELVDEKDDWKRFLDLVEERGGATSATDLFAEYVVRTAQLTQLESRSVARAAYADLTADFAQWSPPIIVRLPMADWEFEVAGERIADADAVLDAVTALDAHAAEAGLDRPATVEGAYERVQWSFDGAQHLIADQEATLTAIDDAVAVVAADRSEATNLGLTDLDPEAEVAAAQVAFEANELADARVHAAVAIAMVEAAAARGDAQIAADDMERTVIAGVGGLVLVWLVGLLFMRWRRKKRGVRDKAIPGDELPMYGPPTPDLLDPDAVYGPPTPVPAFVGAEAPAPEVPEPPGLD